MTPVLPRFFASYFTNLKMAAPWMIPTMMSWREDLKHAHQKWKVINMSQQKSSHPFEHLWYSSCSTAWILSFMCCQQLHFCKHVNTGKRDESDPFAAGNRAGNASSISTSLQYLSFNGLCPVQPRSASKKGCFPWHHSVSRLFGKHFPQGLWGFFRLGHQDFKIFWSTDDVDLVFSLLCLYNPSFCIHFWQQILSKCFL